MDKESPDSPEPLKDSPDSPDDGKIFFVEDRRPGNLSVIYKDSQPGNSQLNGSFNSEEFIVLDSLEESDINNSQTSQADSHDEDESRADDNQLTEDLCLVVEDRSPQLTGHEIQTPRYTISENILKAQNPEPVRNKFANQCFNCGETTHPLRDCPLPRNHAEINRKRKEFLGNRSNDRPVYKRYHVEESQLHSHLVPGEMSKELRQALGIDRTELPSFIYQMRNLGYPPGWLEEAIIPQSGMAMFDGQGKELATPGSQNGGGSNNNLKEKIDPKKLMRYPGFNIPPPPGTHDDYDYYQCSPMSRRQSIETMVVRLGERVAGGYKRKRLSLVRDQNGDISHSTESQDMEYEETPEAGELPADNCKFVPPLPDSEELPPPPPLELPKEPVEEVHPIQKTPNQSKISTTSGERSLEDLEEQKRALLAQLNDTSPLCSTPNSRIGQTKTVDLGTPILKSVSPFARLPSAEKFSVNICDVINFENLPDSTGKYEQMSGLLKKVRTKLSKINSEP